MSADNVIAILQTRKGNGFEYRVAHQMAIENYKWDDKIHDYTNDPKIQIKNARKMWNGCKVITDRTQAFQEASAQLQKVGYVEYGIQDFFIDAEF